MLEGPEQMSRVIAFANHKGGVAKTTTTLSIGAALHERGLDVLLVDLDPQGALTYSLGFDPDGIEETVDDVLLHHLPVEKAVIAGSPRSPACEYRPGRRRRRAADQDGP